MVSKSTERLFDRAERHPDVLFALDGFKWTATMSEWKAAKERAVSTYGRFCVVMFQVGNFYETYFSDAVVYSAVLDAALTRKDKSEPKSAVMSGSPISVADAKVAALVSAGISVVLVSETGPDGKGWKVREATYAATPGTFVPSMNFRGTNGIFAATEREGRYVYACLDPFVWNASHGTAFSEKELSEAAARLSPKEAFSDSRHPVGAVIKDFSESKPSDLRVSEFLNAGVPEENAVLFAWIAEYAEASGNVGKSAFRGSSDETARLRGRFVMDPVSLANLEVFEQRGWADAFSAVNAVSTSMGERLLKERISMPFSESDAINRSRRMSEELVRTRSWEKFASILANASDAHRLASRLSSPSFKPEWFWDLLRTAETFLSCSESLLSAGISESFPSFGNAKAVEAVESAVSALSWNLSSFPSRGNLFSENYDSELSSYSALWKDKGSVLDALESKYRNSSGTPERGLRVVENGVGFYLECHPGTRPHATKAEGWEPARPTPKKDRWTCPELEKAFRDSVVAETKALAREAELAESLRISLSAFSDGFRLAGDALAELDFASGAASLVSSWWTYADVSDDHAEDRILKACHPAFFGKHVPNDFSAGKRGFRILTGPNMGGKTMYMKAVALSVLLAHAGMPVPAKYVELRPCRGIFFRSGSGDDMSEGRSTFFVEMRETADILAKVSEGSYAFFDEIGRGTDSKDGEAVAWWVVSKLSEIGVKGVFATHYHGMTESENAFPNVWNLHVSVEVENGVPKFDHRVVDGPPSERNSYGLEIARLAGIPEDVIASATGRYRNAQ